MDWDHDGDSDFDDGFIEAAFWFGPGWLTLLIVAVVIGLWVWG
jgi:hypothetical protein